MAKSSLSTLIKNKAKILDAYNTRKFGKKQKTLRSAAYPELEECLVRWLKMVRAKKIPVDRKLLKEQAETYALKLGIENFNKSDGWVTRFKERNDLTLKKICGESASVDRNVTDDWIKSTFKNLTKRYTPDNIYNADETGLFYRALPDKTITFKNDVCSGGKKSKERITLLLASNMDGSDKLPLLIIGKSKNPRCFKGMPRSSMPAEYTNNENAWMTMIIWEKWLRELDRKCTMKKRKICLIIDNCSAHGEVEGLKSLELVYLPPNTTSIIQPMDQGIIHALKKNYRKAVCRRILLCIESGKDYKIDLLSAMFLVSQEWKNLSSETISKCFRHAGFVETPESITSELAPIASCSQDQTAMEGNSSDNTNAGVTDGDSNGDILLNLRDHGYNVPNEISFEDFIRIDENTETAETLSDDQIVASVLANEHTRDTAPQTDDDSSDDDMEAKLPVKSEQLVNAINVLKRFYRREENSLDVLEYVDFLENDVAIRKQKKLSQQSLLDYIHVQK